MVSINRECKGRKFIGNGQATVIYILYIYSGYMLHNMKNTLPLFAFFLLIISSCKKGKDEEPKPNLLYNVTTYNYISTSILPYKFKVGTYWVYENDSTGILDSIVVDSISTGFFISTPSVHSTTGETKTEFYKMNIHSFGSSTYYNESLINFYLTRNYSGEWYNFQGQKIYAANHPIGTTSDGMTIIAKFLSMNVGINTFNNVDKVEIIAANQSSPEYAFDTQLYFCDSIGLIKKGTILSPGNIESWSIKRWNIVR